LSRPVAPGGEIAPVGSIGAFGCGAPEEKSSAAGLGTRCGPARLERFAKPEQLVGYLGLNPSVRQSGPGPAYHASGFLPEVWIADEPTQALRREISGAARGATRSCGSVRG